MLLLTTLPTVLLHDTYIALFVTLKMYIASHSPLVTWIAFSCVGRHLSYWILYNSFRTVDQCRTLGLTYHRAIDVMNMLITIFVTKNFVVWTAVWCKIRCRNKELKQWKKNSRWDIRLSKLFSRIYLTLLKVTIPFNQFKWDKPLCTGLYLWYSIFPWSRYNFFHLGFLKPII